MTSGDGPIRAGANQITRLAARFAELRGRGERALIPYFTAGDPSLDVTRRLVLEAARQGADIVELGVPFSDPLADGPVIQRAGQRALRAGVTLVRVLELARELRTEIATPLVLLTYYNPVLAFGLKAFARDAAQAGVDGVIVADLPPEEAGPFASEAEAAGVDLVHLAAPTSTPARLRLIARRSRGFVYVVSLMGVTGIRDSLPPEVEGQLRALRLITTQPICVGFGISSPEQVRTVGRHADGVIVGSAIVRLAEQHAAAPGLVAEVGRFIATLKAPLREASG
jgi:tryptophan synthase alpha chain